MLKPMATVMPAAHEERSSEAEQIQTVLRKSEKAPLENEGYKGTIPRKRISSSCFLRYGLYVALVGHKLTL